MNTNLKLTGMIILSLSLCSLSSWANEDREKAQFELDQARNRLAEVQGIALERPGTPEDEIIAQEEALALKQANKSFLKFAASDCTNRTYHEGAIGGSALGLGVTLCLIEKTQARIQELSDRYDIEQH